MASLTAADVKKLKVQELKDELTARGLDTSGLKAVLVERLIQAIETPAEALPTAAEGADDAAPADGEVAAAAPEAAAGATVADAGGAADTNGEGAATDAAASKLGPVELELEKRKKRAERFGIEFKMSEEEKRKLRAERFGPETVEAEDGKSKEADEEEKKKARGARFGTGNIASGEEEDKKAARAQRFGTGGSGGLDTKKMGRMGLPVEAGGGKRAGGIVLDEAEIAKKKKRLERFGPKE